MHSHLKVMIFKIVELSRGRGFNWVYPQRRYWPVCYPKTAGLKELQTICTIRSWKIILNKYKWITHCFLSDWGSMHWRHCLYPGQKKAHPCKSSEAPIQASINALPTSAVQRSVASLMTSVIWLDVMVRSVQCSGTTWFVSILSVMFPQVTGFAHNVSEIKR